MTQLVEKDRDTFVSGSRSVKKQLLFTKMFLWLTVSKLEQFTMQRLKRSKKSCYCGQSLRILKYT